MNANVFGRFLDSTHIKIARVGYKIDKKPTTNCVGLHYYILKNTK
jgi:hypothetical protein